MKEEEVYRTIEKKLEEIGVVNHPGIKEIIKGCFDYNMEPENVTIEVKNGNVVIKENYHVQAINSDVPDVAVSERGATIQNNENNITLTNYTICKENEVVNGKLTGRSGNYVSERVERKINEYGIEMDRTSERYNFDGMVDSSVKRHRRGLSEVFYEYRRIDGYSETGILAVDYDKLESLTTSSRPGLSDPIYCPPISYENIQKFSAHLTPKQQLFLGKLPNDGFLHGIFTINGESVNEYKAEKNKGQKDELKEIFVNSKEEAKTNENKFHI